MNISDLKAGNALGGKTARACDSCSWKSARWFCAADDAFLCEACDASVHTANQLASRHERVGLKTSSFKGSSTTHEVNSSPVPSWHQGFTQKARTPRHAKGTRFQTPPQHTLPLVPEINGDQDPFFEENEDQLLYRVPVFDPYVSEFCSEIGNIGEEADYDDQGDLNLEELLTCDAELTDFAADIESVLRKNDSDDKMEIKIEDEDIAITSDQLDMELNWDFDYASNFDHHMSSGGEDMKKVCSTDQSTKNIFESSKSDESQLLSQVKNRMLLLRLNYEEVITDWANQGCGCPWTNGVRPQFNLDDFQIAWCDGNYINPYGGGGNIDSEREARVSRYREKRRTRLFSKKIRYQVRKLNAEKRPRMKGRFVKRTDNLFRLLPSLPNL